MIVERESSVSRFGRWTDGNSVSVIEGPVLFGRYRAGDRRVSYVWQRPLAAFGDPVLVLVLGTVCGGQQQAPRLVWSLLIYALKDARAFHT